MQRPEEINDNAHAVFRFRILLVVSLANAGDERSIKNLAKALTGLAADVDPAEAQALSYTAHTTARRLKKEYRVALNRSLRYFCTMSVSESAAGVGIGPRTLGRN